jgi:two-component system sensor histidine kinase KdpD
MSNHAATALGVLGVSIVGVTLGPFQDQVSRATQALALIAVVIATSVVGRLRAAQIVAVAATLCFALLVPPIGSLHVAFGADVFAVAALFVIASTVARLVTGRIEALGRVEHQRSVLLRSVSHDLRTPLSSIRAAASDLLDPDTDDESTRHRLLTLIASEAERLDRLVANLLSFSRIEAGALVPHRQSVDLAELVEVCAGRLERLFADRATLEVDLSDDLPNIEADYVLLDQVLTNLLENAARHSPVGGVVRVTARASSGGMTMAVADMGPGIEASEVETIFRPFRSGRVAGTSGIGLAICRAIVEAHGGTIRVGDVPGGGAKFTVTLPAA